jgi:hypothetical protein
LPDGVAGWITNVAGYRRDAAMPIGTNPALTLHNFDALPPWQVDVYTAFHDPHRCFQETVSGPFSVTVAGGWFPRAIAGRCLALCAYIRCCLVALRIAWLSWQRGTKYDVVVVDQVSVVNWVLRWLNSARILFYCHFPDLLLAARKSALHSAYRAPLDWVEQASTGAAHHILVNSAFTQGAVGPVGLLCIGMHTRGGWYGFGAGEVPV